MPAQNVLQRASRGRDLRTTVSGAASGQQGGLEEDGIWDSVFLSFILDFIRVVVV